MTAIAFDVEQIRTAPADVRQWILHEVTRSLRLQSWPAVEEPAREHLASCNSKEIAAIFSQIQGVLPAVNVFFELGRQAAVIPGANVEAFGLLDIAHHTRLQNVAQVIAYIDIINQALGRIRNEGSTTFCGFDRDDHCYVALETQQNILRLWQSVLAGRQLASGGEAPSSKPAPVADGNTDAVSPASDNPSSEQPVDRWLERDEDLSEP